MKLRNVIFQNDIKILKQKEYQLPSYDREAVKIKTNRQPQWLHLGAGNIFRAFLATGQQETLNANKTDTGIIVADGYDYELIDFLNEYDQLTISATLCNDGTIEKKIVSSVTEYLKMDMNCSDFDRLLEIVMNPTLQMITMTITEKGYQLRDHMGNFSSIVENDAQNGPEKVEGYIGKLVALLYARFRANATPIAVVSMDNMSQNGAVLQKSVLDMVHLWKENHKVEQDFIEYLENSTKVSFPWTMIDKITPRPSEEVEKLLLEDGFVDIAPIITSKHTYVAPYVNAEEIEYLVIEDCFPNGRPPLETAGFYFTDRVTVNLAEKMKVSTCLNPLHTALAVFGCLLDYQYIYEEMQDDDLVRLVSQLGYKEGLPVSPDPKIFSPKVFLDQVIQKRLPNPFMQDTPQRIATDTSQKLAIRFGETIHSYQNTSGLSVQKLQAIPFVLAGWLRYLVGINDAGNVMEISPDPMLQELLPFFKDIKIGTTPSNEIMMNISKNLLSNENIFGCDLNEVGLASIILENFLQMIQGNGAVKETLKHVCNGFKK